MGRVFRFLGMSVGIIVHGLTNDERRAAHSADVTYGTNNEFGFDYLRDNMAIYKSQMVGRDHHAFAIVDEVDSILIDEARTPLIISGQGEKPTFIYTQADKFAASLRKIVIKSVDEKEDNDDIDGDYIIDSRFISGGRCALVGANASYVAMMDEDVVVKVEYEGKTLKNYSFNTSVETFSLALSKSGDGRQCDLITYNDNGVAVFTADSNAGSDSVSAYRNTVATMDNNTIYIYNKTGELRGTCFAGSGARRLILCSDNEAYVLSVTQIRKIDLTDTKSTADSAAG
jgi:hypothetical protein